MGVATECSSAAALLLALRNLITLLFISANKSLLSFSQKSKLLHLLRWLFITIFFLVFHSLPTFLTFLFPPKIKGKSQFPDGFVDDDDDDHRNHKPPIISSNGSPIARALHQILSLVNEIPVSSRKYDVVRCLAENLIDENLKSGSDALREVNCIVISEGFARTLTQLESALLDRDENYGLGFGHHGLGRAVKAALEWYWARKSEVKGGIGSGEAAVVDKMAAELLWLAEKLEGSDGVEAAVDKWAAAGNLGRRAMSAEPRIQASLVKLTSFLIKRAKDIIPREQGTGEGETEKQKQTNMKMLMAWLPLLCQATNGIDAPTLSASERGEIERALEDIINMFEEENQEKVLSLWLHHFSKCPSSDWPNLHGSYSQWCSTSRKYLLTP